jgi:hypothetical protein
MHRIKRFKIFENLKGIEEITDEVNLTLLENLDPYDSIAGGECHDIALISFTYCSESGFLLDPKLCWTGNHAWVEGIFQYGDEQFDAVLDIVALNQPHLGRVFKPISEAIGEYYRRDHESRDPIEYIRTNFGVNIQLEEAQYGAEELSILDMFIV